MVDIVQATFSNAFCNVKFKKKTALKYVCRGLVDETVNSGLGYGLKMSSSKP